MTRERRRDLALTYAPPAAVALAIIALQFAHFGGLYAASDDSYIYLGYVKRALEPPRQLFSYNPGEHSAGTTGISYYYALVIAAAVVRAATFYLPMPTTLTLTMYLVNGALFVGCAGLLTRLVSQMTGAAAVWGIAALVLLLWNVRFMWGMFAGLENPLSAFLIVALVSAIARGAPLGLIAVLTALLAGARPELLPTLALIPAFATVVARLPLRAEPAWWAGIAWRAAAATALCAAVVLALALPCWITTGRVFPSALGTRVAIAVLGDPHLLWEAASKFTPRAMLRNDWALGSVALLLCLAVVAPYRNVRVPLAAMVFVTLQFAVRAVLGLVDLNVEHRYVSYLWPLYVLAIMPLLHGVVCAWRGAATLLARPAGALAIGGALAVYGALGPLREFDDRFSADVREMNQIVVTPAQWMQDHLPAGSRVSTDTAGAVRVFTDFYLVDRIGLTTQHSWDHASYADSMTTNRVDYAFEFPVQVKEFAESSRYDRLMSWRPQPQRHSLGEIAVFRLRGS